MSKLYGWETLQAFSDAARIGSTINILGFPFIISSLHTDLANCNGSFTLSQLHKVKEVEPDQLRTVREALTVTLARNEELERQLYAAKLPVDVDWLTCERVSNEDHVDEAIRTFVEDQTGDNATGIILAALTVFLADYHKAKQS